ncbi:MAG: MaoC family dehydratase [Acidobacteria bacterium]|jgi:acyl dehydratase|nr:MaoC family dehydratase [Acidobacteriota bacterium]
MAKTTIDVKEITTLVGRKFVAERWHEVTQAQVNGFADATGDHQWIHVDPERARRESPFGRPIAHGYLSLSLAPMFLFEELDVTGARFVVNYGLNKVRFPAPVPVGSRVRMAFEGLAVDPIEGGWQVTMKASLEVEGSPKPAVVAELVYRYLL